MALPVTACKVHRDVVVLIVDLPDSTLAIPEWMARPEAAALGVRSPPLVPLQHLRQPSFVLRAMERAALVPLVRKMLLEILFSGVALTSNKESDDE
jgi:hypothetical protein